MSFKHNLLKVIFERYFSWRLGELFAPRYPIVLNYPIRPEPRFGYGCPPHPELLEVIEAGRANYSDTLQSLNRYRDDLRRIPLVEPKGLPAEARWCNAYFSGLDAAALYGLIRERKPRRIVEVGSGNSTKFAARAIRDGGLSTELVSIDPAPRAEIDQLCSKVHRCGLEAAELRIFAELQSGDFLFIDNSHRCFTNSDVTVFFLEILPRLPRGVVVHLHDIFLPLDYPPVWNAKYYSEQYLLAVYLLAKSNHSPATVLLPCVFVSSDATLRNMAEPLWEGTEIEAMFRSTYDPLGKVLGTSFWMES